MGKKLTEPWKKVKDMIHGADVIVEVLDARDIDGTRIPLAERWSGVARLLKIANKSDLCPEGKLPEGILTVSAKNRAPEERKAVLEAIMTKAKKRPVKALLIGYPNVGKSSLINMLANRKAAKVSHVAGTTRNIQWVRIDEGLMVSDYRGVFPRSEPESEMLRKGALNVTAEREGYAYKFAQKALRSPVLRAWLEKSYDIDLEGAADSGDVLTRIAQRRGWLLKGGEPDLTRVAMHLLKMMAEAPVIK
ncbi:MAG: GTPase [Candidatus Micrarchaeota archaeon]